jgi:arginine decarboxylase
VKPYIGARVKLATKVEGHWAGDSGDRSLFGLTAVELITVVDTLKEAGMIDCFQMLHYHLGSQVTNILNIRDGLKEACRFYIGLIEDGAPLGYLDLGGGLAVDYAGAASTQSHSRNYDLDEYCVDVVETIMNSMDANNVPHPTIVTESGRWTVAPMSVLMFNVLAVTNFDPEPVPELLPEGSCEGVVSLFSTLEKLRLDRLQENYNDAIYYRDQLRDSFRAGAITLRERALGENLYLAIVNRINSMLPQLRRVPAELQSLSHSLSDIYYGNFSVFQSLPDAWAIEQVFPVMPLHRLKEKPTRKSIIADLTCDCDGKLDRFASADGEIVRTLDLHRIIKDEPYYLGVFLVGAYQETLGDLHNLFGDNNVASIRVAGDGSVEFVEEVPGDTIADVLSYVEYEPRGLLARFRSMAEDAVRQKMITVEVRQQMVKLFRKSLQGFTYFAE